MSGGYRYLAKNIGLLTISNFATKILSFFLIPLYTSVLSTSEYGTYDLMSVTIQLLVPILTLNISEAILRFALDEDADEKGVFAVGLRYTLAGMLIVTAGVALNQLLGISEMISQWWLVFLLMYASHSLLTTVTYFARGLDQMRHFAIAGVIGSAVTIALNIILLLPLHMGLVGYFVASIAGTFSQLVYLVIALKLWRYTTSHRPDKRLEKDMRTYGTPMMANSIAWWVNSVSDRYIVTAFCGVGENGIYAIGSKIPQILNIVQTIFNQAWTLSAVKEFDEQDKNGFFVKTYNAYGCIMVVACSALILLDRPLAHFLYAADFYEAWRYVPFLLVSMVFGALSGHIGGVFAAVKDSKLYAKTTVVGAVANVILNLITVPFIGAQGAAISTAISYWVVWVVRRRELRQYMQVDLRLRRDYISYFVLIAQSTLLLAMPSDSVAVYALESALLIFALALYREEIATGLGIAMKIVRSKRHKH